MVIGFPSNEFGGQEPQSNSEIAAFASGQQGADFPLLAKGTVNQPNCREKAGCTPDSRSAQVLRPALRFELCIVSRRH